MRRLRLFLSVTCLIMAASSLCAQEDPEIMVINGKSIPRSEFEYFCSRNFQNASYDAKSLGEYADLFLNYKLKVEAAKDAGLDKQQSFIEEFRQYRNMEAESYLLDSTFLEKVARETFDESAREVGSDGIILLGVITVAPYDYSDEAFAAASLRADSIFTLIVERPENFGRLATAFSQDEFARDEGLIGWVSKGQLDENVADRLFDMNEGEYTSPIYTDAGYRMFYVARKKDFGSYADHKESIYEWMKREGIYEDSKLNKANKYAKDLGWNVKDSAALAMEDSLLEELNPEFGNVSREYHDGLLLFEISNNEVWEKATQDSAALEKFFKKNRKKYHFVAPRFKGVLLFGESQESVDKAKAALIGVTMDEWPDILIDLNETDEVVKAITGPVEKGKIDLVDKYVFGEGDAKGITGYPYVDYVGYVASSPEQYLDVASSVINDYQTYLEAQWVKNLRRNYHYKINKKVLSSVRP